ncbi:GGDEF domain-containing protein [Niveibacterium terrae]|uniref:GGDEF domain-containing protein n=1 Tax=Niveibacterium terrae TaxID=3373598 RepID=UPI003A917C65
MLTQESPTFDPLDDQGQELLQIIKTRALTAHFQPIVDLQGGAILGFEALIRGPSDSCLHSPPALFEAAQRCGLRAQMERCALRTVVHRFVELDLPGQIFVNVSSDVLMAGLEQRWPLILAELAEIGLAPRRIVVELTENQPVKDYARLRRCFTLLRTAGFELAIDDLGEGFSSLKRWVESRPDFVKVDRYFIEGLHRDPLKQQFVRALSAIAREAEAKIIAEGVESADELSVLQDIGFTIVQGYLFARPHPSPAASLSPQILKRIRPARSLTLPSAEGRSRTAAALAQQVPTITAAASCLTVYQMFTEQAQLNCLPALDAAGRPIGLLRRLDVMERMSRPYMRELYGRRPCTALMIDAPLIFDAGTSLQTMSEAVVATDVRHYTDGFIVTQGSEFAGMGSIADLMRAITEIQIHTARYANPLTLLPGNVPIHDYVDSLIEQQTHFVVAYFDLDNFKPFNDIYGYRRGDDLIQMTARVLAGASDEDLDFLGHIGGDDFVVIFRSSDWEARVSAALSEFDRTAWAFFDEKHRQEGGYVAQDRRGEAVFHPLVTLSAGVVPVAPGSHPNHVGVSATAAEVKHRAKRMPGSSFFVDRRRSPAVDQPATVSATSSSSRP